MTVSVESCVQLLQELPALALLKKELRRSGSDTGAAGLTALAILAAESVSGTPMRLSALAERLQIDPSVASRQVAHLIDRGSVERVADQHDGRVHRLRVTAAGEHRLQQAREDVARSVADQLAGWEEPELRRLTGLLARLRLDLTHGPAAPPSLTPPAHKITSARSFPAHTGAVQQ